MRLRSSIRLPSALSRALAAFLIAGSAAAADIHVDAASGDDARDGSSWAASVRRITRGLALATASPGPDVVHVAAGTYVENVLVDQVDVQLLGGYPPGGGTRDPLANATIVDGNATAPALTISGNDGNTVLSGIAVDGFTFRNGRQLGRAGILGAGGGIFMEEAQATITNNVITSNVSDGVGMVGAGMYVYRALAGAATISGNRIIGNEARNGNGGGLAVVDVGDPVTFPPIEVTGNELRDNRALALPGAPIDAAAGAGGGMYLWKGQPRITNNVIESNLAEAQGDVTYAGQGGGIFVVDASPIITNNAISANVARALGGAYGGSGGGVYAWRSTRAITGTVPLSMTGNTITNNRAEGGTGDSQSAGGGVAIVIFGETQQTLENNTITGNVAVGGGPSSANGGGVFVFLRPGGTRSVTIRGGSIENNQAEAGGGGLWMQGGAPLLLAATDVLVQANEADYGSGFMLFGDGIVRNLRVRGNRVYDPDGDAVSEISDNCPGLPNGVQSDADGDGAGDACDDDDDGDGTPDASDSCPLVAGGCAGDADGDGVGDGTDNCPMVANAGQEDATADGVGDACEPARFDALETNAGGGWVYGDGRLTNVEIVENVGQGLLIVGDPGDPGAGIPEDPASPTITNVTISANQAAGFITYLADGTRITDSIIARNVLSDGFDTERVGTGVPSSPNVTCNDVYYWDGLASLPCTGTGNMDFTDGDTAFVAGTLGNYYLGQTAAGQGRQFVGVDAGSIPANVSPVNGLTTRTDAVVDAGQVDLGFHYARSAVVPTPGDLGSVVRVSKTPLAAQPYLQGVSPAVTAVRWYRGSIPSLQGSGTYSHSSPFSGEPGDPECNASPAARLSDPAALTDGQDWYYLAVAIDGGAEGSYGADSEGALRPRPEDDPGDLVLNACP